MKYGSPRTIAIAIDSSAPPDWLIYITDAFLFVSQAAFSFEFVDHRYYTKSAIRYLASDDGGSGIFIPRRPDHGDWASVFFTFENESPVWDRPDVRFAGRTIPVLKSTAVTADDSDRKLGAPTRDRAGLPFDVLYNSFARLSCLREYRHQSATKRFDSLAEPLMDGTTDFSVPVVSIVFAYLEQLIVAHFGNGSRAEPLFLEKHSPRLQLTHDVDAVAKGVRPRVRRSGFFLSTGARRAIGGDLSAAGAALRSSAVAAFRRGEFWQFETIREMERRYGVNSVFYFYSRCDGLFSGRFRSAVSTAVFDPDYDIRCHPALREVMRFLIADGCEIGLHGSYNSFNDSGQLRREKELLEDVATVPVTMIRQHWLRFSHGSTWTAQSDAGFVTDMTLGFNDRPGFRAGIADAFYPYDHGSGRAHEILAVPTILMDSQLFDYMDLSESERRWVIDNLIEEVAVFRGRAAVIWHQRVFSDEFGWGKDYEYLLERLTGAGYRS